jgi:hypothetical protein
MTRLLRLECGGGEEGDKQQAEEAEKYRTVFLLTKGKKGNTIESRCPRILSRHGRERSLLPNFSIKMTRSVFIMVERRERSCIRYNAQLHGSTKMFDMFTLSTQKESRRRGKSRILVSLPGGYVF